MYVNYLYSSCTNLFLYIQQQKIYISDGKQENSLLFFLPYLICGSDKIKRKYGVAWHVKDMKKRDEG